jgi:hypothetical protein
MRHREDRWPARLCVAQDCVGPGRRHAPADLTVTTLARGLPYSWAEQERSVGTQSNGTMPANPHPR